MRYDEEGCEIFIFYLNLKVMVIDFEIVYDYDVMFVIVVKIDYKSCIFWILYIKKNDIVKMF